MTGEELKTAFLAKPGAVSTALARSLQDFGYTTATASYVRGEFERLLAGGEPKGGPSMFLAGWIKDGIE